MSNENVCINFDQIILPWLAIARLNCRSAERRGKALAAEAAAVV